MTVRTQQLRCELIETAYSAAIATPKCTALKLVNAQYCANFRLGGTEANCLKKKQFVFRTMHVLFSVEDGTCFE